MRTIQTPILVDMGDGQFISKDTFVDRMRDAYVGFLESPDKIYCNSKYLNHLDLVDELYAALCKISKTSSSFLPADVVKACCAYPHLVTRYRSFEDKLKIAHGVVLMVAIDDRTSHNLGEAGSFLMDVELFHIRCCHPEIYMKLYPKRGPLHPVLEEMIDYLKTDLNPFFPEQPRHHSMLVTNILNYLEVSLLECNYNGKVGLQVIPQMQRFPDFIRAKSGISELFILYLIAAPELVPEKYSSEDKTRDYEFFYGSIYPMIAELIYFSNTINDCLSFYKEIQDGEMVNPISNYAKIKQITPFEALREKLDSTLTIVKSVMKILESSGSSKVKNVVSQYFQGFIAWHLTWNSRYRLKEVLGEWHDGEYL